MKRVYNAFFDLTADDEGLAYWSGRLDKGFSRADYIKVIVKVGGLFDNRCKNSLETRDSTKAVAKQAKTDSIKFNKQYLDNLFRNSCYCINCSLNELPALKEAQCKYVRWGSFPWEEQYGLISDGLALDKFYARQNELVKKMKIELGETSIFEASIPEAVYSGVSNIQVSTKVRQSINNLISRFTPEYKSLSNRQNPFNYNEIGGHSSHADGFIIPKLDSSEGFAWHLYLAIMSIDNGAQAINITQVNLRFKNYFNEDLVRKLIKAIRTYAKEIKNTDIVFGGEGHFPTYSTLTSDFDWIKAVIDIDTASWTKNKINAGAVGTNGNFLECESPELLPNIDNQVLTSGQKLGPLCMLKQENGFIRSFFNNTNFKHAHYSHLDPQAKTNIFLELDGAAVCRQKTDNYGPYQAYILQSEVNDSTCRASVRGGLTQTMLFLSQPSNIRAGFIKYMDQLSLYLSKRDINYSLYFPKLIKVDQNFIFTFFRGELLKRKSSSWLDLQRMRVRHCPKDSINKGLGDIQDADYNIYTSNNCDDTKYNRMNNTLKSTITTGVKNLYTRILKRPADMSGLDYAVKEVLEGRKKLSDISADLIYTDEHKNLQKDSTSHTIKEKSELEVFIKKMYEGYFKRAADAGGLAFYKNLILTKGCREAGITFMYGTKFNGEHGIIFSNREFVMRTYKALYDFKADPEGLNYWAGRLDSGLTRLDFIKVVVSDGGLYDNRCKASY